MSQETRPETLILYCALSGEIQEYQNRLIREVADKFGLKKIITLNVEPHFTLKYWFRADESQVIAVQKLLSGFCSMNLKAPIRVGGFRGFYPSVVYSVIDFSDEAFALINKLFFELRKSTWIEWNEFDAEKLIPHSTIAEDCNDHYEDVMDYLDGKEKIFESFTGAALI